ncbi:MAG: tetratricopeptide repeat protein [Anaeromyxobacteraceae bacterium]
MRIPSPLLVAAAAVAVSANGLLGAPVLDDGWVIFRNPLVTRLDVARIFTEPYNAGGPVTTGGLFRPLTTLTYALTYAAAGGTTWPYHLLNVLLHAGVSVLVWAVARRVVEGLKYANEAALLAGLLFAVHPVHVEAVAGLVGRAELLAAAGVLGALLLALDRRAPAVRLPAALLAGAAGVLSKENAAVLPALHLLVAVATPAAASLPARPGLAPGAPRRALLLASGTAALLALPTLAFLALRPGAGLAAGVPEASAWFAGQPRSVVAGTMARALVEYLSLLVWPHPLGLDFTYAARLPGTPLTGALGAVALGLAALALGLASLRARPVLAVALLWILVALAPVSNVLLPTGVLMAERLLYLPSVGACLGLGAAAGWAAARMSATPARQAVWLLAGVAVLTWSAWTVDRNADWRTPRALWEAELRSAPRDPVVNNNLAVELNGAGEHARAARLLGTALEVAPGYWRAHVNLAIARQRSGDLAGAARAFEDAIRIAPTEPEPRLFLGYLRLERGELDAAVAAFGAAVALGPRDPRMRVGLGDALARQGRAAEARAAYEAALALDARNGPAAAGLARLGQPPG